MYISARTSIASDVLSPGAIPQQYLDAFNFVDRRADAASTSLAKTVILFANTSWYLWNFRLALANRLRNGGFRVVFVAPEDGFSNRLSDAGFFIPIPISRDGAHPLREFGTLARFRGLVRHLQADVVLSWTPKCNIYGALACRSLGVPIVPNVSGLGSGFVDRPVLSRVVAQLYRLAFDTCGTVFFQNSQDMAHLIDRGCLPPKSARLLPGSGVDLVRFQPATTNERSEKDPFVFLFMGRLLKEKGLCELAAAMRRLRSEGSKARLLVSGFFDEANPSALKQNDLREWEAEGIVEFVGPTDRPESLIGRADCVVHPSFYREGLARVLLESAACARPVITTDVAGCREAIIPDVSGFLCRPRDAESLYAAMKHMLRLPAGVRKLMGYAAREHMERGFSEEIVIGSYFDVLHALQRAS